MQQSCNDRTEKKEEFVGFSLTDVIKILEAVWQTNIISEEFKLSLN